MPLPDNLMMSLIAFAFVSSITPGPNNLMLLASGVNFGVARSIPHMLGIAFGFTVMLVAVGLGLGVALQAAPQMYAGLRWVAIGYLLWLAWKIASAPITVADAVNTGRPMSFLAAALFQWVNPKAWSMALTGVTAFTVPTDYLASVLTMAAIFGVVNLPSVGVWTLFGVGLRRFLADPVRLRTFNVAMALLLVASIYPLIAEAIGRPTA